MSHVIYYPQTLSVTLNLPVFSSYTLFVNLKPPSLLSDFFLLVGQLQEIFPVDNDLKIKINLLREMFGALHAVLILLTG